MSPFKVAKVLLLDDDTIRVWHQTFEQDRIDGLVGFHYGGRQADLNSIERLWLVMHKALIHTRCAASFRQFRARVLTFLRYDVPSQWDVFCDQVTKNFRIRDPSQFRNLR